MGNEKPITYDQMVRFIFLDWIENAEGEEADELKEKIASMKYPIDEMYQRYMKSDVQIYTYDDLTDLIGQILK